MFPPASPARHRPDPASFYTAEPSRRPAQTPTASPSRPSKMTVPASPAGQRGNNMLPPSPKTVVDGSGPLPNPYASGFRTSQTQQQAVMGSPTRAGAKTPGREGDAERDRQQHGERPKMSTHRQSSRASTLSSRPSPNLGSSAYMTSPYAVTQAQEQAHQSPRPAAQQTHRHHQSHQPGQYPHGLRDTTRHNVMPPPSAYGTSSSMEGQLSPPLMSPASGGAGKSPREAWIETPPSVHEAHVGVAPAPLDVESQFEQLLDTLQIPSAVREKFHSVSSDVKSSLLSSSLLQTPAHLTASAYDLPLPPSMSAEGPMPRSPRGKELKKRLSTPLLRKAKSSDSLGSPGPIAEVGKTYRVDGEKFTIVASPLQSPELEQAHGVPGGGGRGQSFDLSRSPAPHVHPQAQPQGRPPNTRGSTGPAATGLATSSRARPTSLVCSPAALGSPMKGNGLGQGRGLGIAMGGEQPGTFLTWLSNSRATDPRMDVGRAKKLRMLLRHESTEWVREWVDGGGCGLVLARLGDLLDVEWREEQHDDQMLHELLRCVRALFTSEVGKVALRQHFPHPFPELSKLLFSEKKPGDLPTRQLIIEMWTMLFELYPPGSFGDGPPLSHGKAQAGGSRPSSVRFDSAQTDAALRALNGIRVEQAQSVNIVAEVRNLLVPTSTESGPKEDIHDFMKAAHRPKVWKAWVGEMADICRDYFWIMCHGSNTLWALDEVDESLVERPVAPGGATGGVEFEAMNYVTCHFKLINTLCKYTAMQSRTQATEMHKELFISGMDRILATFRKASTTYYPTLHLELARYVTHLRAASPQARLPHLIDKMVGSPPEDVRKRGVLPAHLPQFAGVAGTDGGRRGAFDMQY